MLRHHPPLTEERHRFIQASRPQPFIVWRHEDVTGVSGDGMKVGEGVLFSDGWAVTHWLPTLVKDQPSTVTWYYKGMEPPLEIHGHDGKTEIFFLGEIPPHIQAALRGASEGS